MDEKQVKVGELRDKMLDGCKGQVKVIYIQVVERFKILT